MSLRYTESESLSVLSDSLWLHGLYSPWNSPGQNTGVGSLSLLQEIFPTQESNPGLPHCRQILYQLSYKGSPRILEWITYPFSRGFSWPRNQTRVSCIAGRYFTNCTIRVGNVSIISHNWIFAEKSYQRSLEQKRTLKGSVYAWIRLPLLHSKRKNPAHYLLR